MDINKIKQELDELKSQIVYHSNLYYNENRTEITDYEYDMLMNRLKEIESQYPQLITEDSPTQQVQGLASSTFEKVAHAVKMESLLDAFSYDELRDFDRRVREAVDNPQYVVETKIDGLSMSLEYVNGVFTRGSTRGDGLVGEDVTANLATIKSIPKTIKNAPEFLEVRGEVYMPKEVFFELIAKQENEGKTPFKNPRNAASGSVRQKDSKITKERKLYIFILMKLNLPVTNSHLIYSKNMALKCHQNSLYLIILKMLSKKLKPLAKCVVSLPLILTAL